MIKFIRKLKNIVKNYDVDKKTHEEKISNLKAKITLYKDRIIEAENLIKDRTTVSVDSHQHVHNPNQIIVIGRYRKRDFVQVYTLQDNDLDTLVTQLSNMQKYGHINKIDAPQGFKKVITREIDYRG